MKTQLKHVNQIPCCEGGFRLVDPSTGQESFANNFTTLLKDIRSKRKANGKPMGLEFEQEIEALVCAKYPDECENVGPGSVRQRELTLGDIVAGSKVMMAHWWNDKKLVSREIAESRARTCVSCPNNRLFAKPCVGMCAELRDAVGAITDHQGTQYDSQLNSCQICGCFLQAAIWLPLEIQCVGVNDEQRAQFLNVPNCWKQCT